MLAKIKNENKHDIRPFFVRNRRAHSVGHGRDFKGAIINRAPYVSRSDWALHRARRLGRWGVYSTALRQRFAPAWHSRTSGFTRVNGAIRLSHDLKGVAWCEMKQFLIEQIPVLFFIAAFFLMMALGG